MKRMACYTCGEVHFRWRLVPVEGVAWRLCRTCFRVKRERFQATQEGFSAGQRDGFEKGRVAGANEERGKRWVAENGRRDS